MEFWEQYNHCKEHKNRTQSLELVQNVQCLDYILTAYWQYWLSPVPTASTVSACLRWRTFWPFSTGRQQRASCIWQPNLLPIYIILPRIPKDATVVGIKSSSKTNTPTRLGRVLGAQFDGRHKVPIFSPCVKSSQFHLRSNKYPRRLISKGQMPFLVMMIWCPI